MNVERRGSRVRLRAHSILEIPADRVFAYHERPGALVRLTPGFENVQVLRSDGSIQDGAQAELRLRLGPVGLRWVAKHHGYRPEQWEFSDTQVRGPFASWEHVHRVEALDPQRSRMVDEVEFRLPFGALGALGAPLAIGKLSRFFAYRHRVLAHDLGLERRLFPMGVKKKRVVVAGASGLLGQSLVALLSATGHQVVRLVRDSSDPGFALGEAHVWQPERGTLDASILEGADAVVHLGGVGVARRWSSSVRDEIMRSRVDSTALLAETIASLREPPEVFLCASGVSIYGESSEPVDEETAVDDSAPDSFLAGVCRRWEAATEPAQRAGVRVVNARIGIVLSPQGGALAKMLPAFRLGLGGPIGGGEHSMSWISHLDAIGGLYTSLFDSDLEGPVNLTAPHPVAQSDFARVLGRTIGRPSFLATPAWAIHAAFGEMGRETALASLNVRPRRLIESGYRFAFSDLDDALGHELGYLAR